MAVKDSHYEQIFENSSQNLSPPQRPLSCCFDRKGFLSVDLGRGKKGSARETPFPLPIVPCAPSQTQHYSKFPIGSLWEGESLKIERLQLIVRLLALRYKIKNKRQTCRLSANHNELIISVIL